MALLRAELKGSGQVINLRREDGTVGTKVTGIYEGIIETAEDLTAPRLGDFGQGSLLFCMENKSLYVKNSSGEWEAILG